MGRGRVVEEGRAPVWVSPVAVWELVGGAGLRSDPAVLAVATRRAREAATVALREVLDRLGAAPCGPAVGYCTADEGGAVVFLLEVVAVRLVVPCPFPRVRLFRFLPG